MMIGTLKFVMRFLISSSRTVVVHYKYRVDPCIGEGFRIYGTFRSKFCAFPLKGKEPMYDLRIDYYYIVE